MSHRSASTRVRVRFGIAVVAVAGCRGILGIDELPPDRITETDLDGGEDAERATRTPKDGGPDAVPPPSGVDPAWALWQIPPDVKPASYDLREGVLTDLVTGLDWQRTSGPPAAWGDAAAYCASLDLPPGGWRLPTRIELISLMDFSLPIRGNPFSPTMLDPAWNCYWMISANSDRNAHWLMVTETALVGMSTRDTTRCIPRCVVGPPYDPTTNHPPDYVAGGGTVLDPATHLEWEAYASGTAGVLLAFDDAMARCDALDLGGHADWRVPTVKELASLVDERRVLPSLAPAVAGEPKVYWSSTLHAPKAGTDAGARPLHWRVSFSDGVLEPEDDDDAFAPFVARTRCVRPDG